MRTQPYSSLNPAGGHFNERDWAQAVEGLRERYYQVSRSMHWMKEEQAEPTLGQTAASLGRVLNELQYLQQEMRDTLCELMMNVPEEGPASLARRQLREHVLVLQQINNRVDAFLARLSAQYPLFGLWLRSDTEEAC